MNQIKLPPTFSKGLRAALINRIDIATAPTTRRRRARWIGLAIVGGIGLLGGAGMATATILTQPGGTEVAELAPPVTATRTGTGTVELGNAPSGATNVRVSFICLSAGTFAFPDGASVSCSDSDASGPVRLRTTNYSVALTANQHSVTIITSPTAT